MRPTMGPRTPVKAVIAANAVVVVGMDLHDIDRFLDQSLFHIRRDRLRTKRTQ